MKVLSFFRKASINDALKEYRKNPDMILLDVREADEFRSGHIPGAINMPLSVISQVTLPKDKPIFVYCLRGTRSRQAVSLLTRMGYQNVRNIGGITSYEGQLEKG